MERLFKVTNVFRTTIEGRNQGDAQRPKVEITLTYHETSFSSQNGMQLRCQSEVVSLLDEAANLCELETGQWVVASLSHIAFPSRADASRVIPTTFLDRYIPVDVSQL